MVVVVEVDRAGEARLRVVAVDVAAPSVVLERRPSWYPVRVASSARAVARPLVRLLAFVHTAKIQSSSSKTFFVKK